MKKFSSHDLANVLLRRKDFPIRALVTKRFAIAWDGKRGDIKERVSTAEVFGREQA